MKPKYVPIWNLTLCKNLTLPILKVFVFPFTIRGLPGIVKMFLHDNVLKLVYF